MVSMDLQLTGKNCIVLGGSRGIGRAIALGLAAEGANVAICARDEAALHKAERELLQKGVKAYAASCDVANQQALSAFLNAARAALGGVDILVHNASALAVGPGLDDWNASLAVDLMAAVHACEQVIPWLLEQGSGAIILVSSISGLECDPSPDYGYTAAKAALIAYAKKLAVMHAAQGLRVNAIAPGSTEFPEGIWAQLKVHQPEIYQMAQSSIPAGRLGSAEEIADVAVFLASPRAQWVNGECISIDGAQHRGMR